MKSNKPLKVVGWLGNIGITTMIHEPTRKAAEVEKKQSLKETSTPKLKGKLQKRS
jgi:hypothetical protein